MDKPETYTPDTPEAPETYPPLPSLVITPEDKPKELSGIKRFCLCIGMIILGSGLAFAVVCIGLTPQFLTDQDCFALQNESFINGTNIGSEYIIASITQEAVQCNQIPISYGGYNYTLIAIECLNLTKSQEDINNE